MCSCSIRWRHFLPAGASVRYSLQWRNFCLTPSYLEKLNSNSKRYAGWLKSISQVFVLKRSVVWFIEWYLERGEHYWVMTGFSRFFSLSTQHIVNELTLILHSLPAHRFWRLKMYVIRELLIRGRGRQLKGLCHDSAHVWAVTVANCLWTNRKRVRCTRGNLHNSRFIVREAGVFRTLKLFDFIYPHNSYLFPGIPQKNVAADKNKINNPVLLWNKHLPTCIFTYPR